MSPDHDCMKTICVLKVTAKAPLNLPILLLPNSQYAQAGLVKERLPKSLGCFNLPFSGQPANEKESRRENESMMLRGIIVGSAATLTVTLFIAAAIMLLMR